MFLYQSVHHANLTTQTTSTIHVLPAEICLYKRIHRLDIVRMLRVPFLDMIGTVEYIYQGTGWYIVKTPGRHLRLYRTDIELHDRLCAGDFVRVIVHGSFLGKQGVVKAVDAEGNIEIAVSPSDVSLMSFSF